MLLYRVLTVSPGFGLIVAPAHSSLSRNNIRHNPTADPRLSRCNGSAERWAADFRGTALYFSLQPCGMVSIWSKTGRIIDSAGRRDAYRMYFEDRHLDTFDFIADAFRDDLVLIGVSVVAFYRRKHRLDHP